MNPSFSSLPGGPAAGPTTIPVTAEPAARRWASPVLVELLVERNQRPLRYLRPIEVGAAYYDLSRVERAVDPEVENAQQLLASSARRTWEPLGPVYLLAHTLQTLRWRDSPEPGTYHVGRVPEADSYRFTGEQHEYSLSELLGHVEQGPAAFRGYPIMGSGEHRLQFTPALAGEAGSESAEWESVGKWLRAGPEQLHEGVHYQLYEELPAGGVAVENGTSPGPFYLSQRAGEGEWLTPYSRIEMLATGGWQQLLSGLFPA